MVNNKNYSTRTKLTAKQVNAYLNGKTFTHKPDIHNNDDNEEYEIIFPDLKRLNKVRNMNIKNKGTRLKPEDILDIKVHHGNGFWDSIRRGFSDFGNKVKDVVNNPITKSIVKTIAPIATQMAGNALKQGVTAYTGNPALGEVAGDLGQQGLQAGSNAYTGGKLKRGKQVASAIAEYNFSKKQGGSCKKQGGSVIGISKQQLGFANPKPVGAGITGYQRGSGLSQIENHNMMIGLEPNREPSSDAGLVDRKAKMALVRSYRKAAN